MSETDVTVASLYCLKNIYSTSGLEAGKQDIF
jgi:hypothetical protein